MRFLTICLFVCCFQLSVAVAQNDYVTVTGNEPTIIHVDGTRLSNIIFHMDTVGNVRIIVRSLSTVDPMIRVIGAGGELLGINDNHNNLENLAPVDAVLDQSLNRGNILIQVRDSSGTQSGNVVISVEVIDMVDTETQIQETPLPTPESPTPISTETPQIIANYDPPQNRQQVPVDALVLSGGIGLTDGSPMNDGNMQIEGYCARLGYNIREDGVDWFCTSETDGIMRFSSNTFDDVCRATYNNPFAYALQSGDNRNPAYNWRCYSHLAYDNPTKHPARTNSVARLNIMPDEILIAREIADPDATEVINLIPYSDVLIINQTIGRDNTDWWEIEVMLAGSTVTGFIPKIINGHPTLYYLYDQP